MLKDMKLYYYEHCPYCIRVLAYCGLSGIELDKQILLNDDEKTPIDLIGQKILPIFQFSDASGKKHVMGESLDIIKILSQNDGIDLIHSEKDDELIANFWRDLSLPVYSLAMPRWVKLSFIEFSTPSSVDYFVTKKTQSIGDFQTALDKTEYWKKEVLNRLGNYQTFFEVLKKQPNSYAALLVFSYLVGLTCVKDLKLPVGLTEFLEVMSQKTGVKLLFDRAI